MKFKARIYGSFSLITDNPETPPNYLFKFSKTKLYFINSDESKREYFLKIPLSCPIRNNTNYEFEIDNNGDKKLYCIYLNKESNCKAVLIMNMFNKIKCNIIHKRYWVYKEPLAAWALIVSIVSLAVSIITIFV